jgi:hypothetical protein
MNEHAAFTGFTLYELHRMLPGYEIYRLLPSYLQLVIGRGRPYLPRNDFFHYCNLVCFNPAVMWAMRRDLPHHARRDGCALRRGQAPCAERSFPYLYS